MDLFTYEEIYLILKTLAFQIQNLALYLYSNVKIFGYFGAFHLKVFKGY